MCRHGEFLAAQIAAYPLLLDELIDERLLTQLPTRASCAAELEERLEQLREDDPEQQVEALRQFQRAALFRVAVADVTGVLPLMQVSDRLTDIAELIVERAMALGWRQITAQFGAPACDDGSGAARRAASARSATASSAAWSSATPRTWTWCSCTTRAASARRPRGAKPIDNQLFFVRLAQRIVHLLTMHSAAGRLYEVDVRLRPSGKGGPAGHQHRGVRRLPARGGLDLGAPGAAARARRGRLGRAARALRGGAPGGAVPPRAARHACARRCAACASACARELSKGDATHFDIKQDPGGIADIEFLAQYWALKWASDYPPVALFADTIRQLESVASADLVPQASVDVLTAAYRAYRARTHHLSLDGAAADRAGGGVPRYARRGDWRCGTPPWR